MFAFFVGVIVPWDVQFLFDEICTNYGQHVSTEMVTNFCIQVYKVDFSAFI